MAAQLLKRRKVHPQVRLYIGPASQAIYERAEKEGLVQTFVEAGAIMMTPGCSLCAGNTGFLAADETCISSSTANYPGRMGSQQAKIYLASPATVAASALAGRITDPREFL